MKRETYLHFISGLGEVIRESGMTQEEFAGVADTSQTNLSRVLNDKTGCSPRWRKRICAALGKTEDEVIERGEHDSMPQVAPVAPIAPAAYVAPEPMDIVSMVATFAKQAQITEEKLRFWRDIFHYLPCAVLLLREGRVLYQNQASSRMCPTAVIGENLCATCREEQKKDRPNCLSCLVEKTQRTGDRSTFHRDIKDHHYIIETSFVTINSVEYQVVISNQVERCDKWQVQKKGEKKNGED